MFLNYAIVKRVAQEIKNVRKWEGRNTEILVSIDENGEARWGEITALSASEMEQEMEKLGYSTDGMIDADAFLEEYLPTLGEVAQEIEGDRPDRVRYEEFELENGTEITLVNDGQFCWIARSEKIEAALNSQISLLAFTSEEAGAWYTELCERVSHAGNLVADFEAKFGRRNWP